MVDIERVYSKEWPSIEQRDGKLIFRQGFLEPLTDPDAPYMFFYRLSVGGWHFVVVG